MPDRFLRPWLFACALALSAAPALSQPKSLFWRSLDVRARLDDAGRLHVVETHAMVFTGDWNGGERVFRVGNGQRLVFEDLERIDASGERHRLTAGDLSEVDQYAFKDPVTLRWRSRLPSDPPFDRAELVYEISYTLSGILTKLGGVYRLNHDFAFTDRAGAIQAFSLELTLDPAWESKTPVRSPITAGPLPPGAGYVVTLPLAYHGSARPIAALGTSIAVRRLVFVLFALALLVLVYVFWSAEARKGRWKPVPDPGGIDASWLEANVFHFLPEEVGALWDEKVGASEVVAVLARMCHEKKISAHADGKKMSLALLVPVETLSGCERSLISGLFFGGRKETDTEAVRAHYKAKGFDPAAKIRPGIDERLRSHPDLQGEPSKPPAMVTAALLISGLALMGMSSVIRHHPWPELVGILIWHFFVYVFAVVAAGFFRNRLDGFGLALTFLWLPLLFLGVSLSSALAVSGTGLFLLLGLHLLRLGLTSSVLNNARIRSGPGRIAVRKKLLAARRFFERELRSPSPRLSDDWYPYILAFGLGPEADRWARSFATAPAAAAVAASSGSFSSSSSGSSSSGSSPAGEWTGGGGSFGGAGASASWAAAASSIASGVSAPSSSSGGGGGGGGGGSSGGGGGGGW